MRWSPSTRQRSLRHWMTCHDTASTSRPVSTDRNTHGQSWKKGSDPFGHTDLAKPNHRQRGLPPFSAAWRDAARRLQDTGHASAELDARLLLAHACGVSQSALWTAEMDHIPKDAFARFETFIARRLSGEPVSRIIGTRSFWKHDFLVSPATLDPRPDSETLVEQVLTIATHEAWEEKPLSILDLGTGTGCLLLSLLGELPKARGTGSDISVDALVTARRNAERLGHEDRATFVATNWFDGINGPFDIIVSNPPYIPSADISGLMNDVRLFDPSVALDGGNDGLDAYRAIISGARRVQDNGWLVLECGAGQSDDVMVLLGEHGYEAPQPNLALATDLSGIVRCVTGRCTLR